MLQLQQLAVCRMINCLKRNEHAGKEMIQEVNAIK
jgi:hypothetical protein